MSHLINNIINIIDYRRFPTTENIEKRRQQREEMIKRGERIEPERGFHRNGMIFKYICKL